MADILGDCTTAGGAGFLSCSSVEHDDACWFVTPRSTPSVAGAVVCGGDATTPLSTNGRSGDVIDSSRTMPRSSPPSTDGGDIAADITRGVDRVPTRRCRSLLGDLPSAAVVSCSDNAYNAAGKRYRASAGWPAGTATAEASRLIEYAERRSMPHWRYDRYYLGNHQRYLPNPDATRWSRTQQQVDPCSKQSTTPIRVVHRTWGGAGRSACHPPYLNARVPLAPDSRCSNYFWRLAAVLNQQRHAHRPTDHQHNQYYAETWSSSCFGSSFTFQITALNSAFHSKIYHDGVTST